MPFLFNILFRFLINPPDIILTHVFSSSMRSIPLARVMFGKKVRIVISQDNIFSYENNQWYERLLVSTIYPMADVIIVQTNISRDDLVKNWKIPVEKIAVIPNWSRDISLKEKKDRDIDIIYCGRFEEQKNLLRLLKICKFLVKKKKDLKVVIIGSGRQEFLLKEYVFKQRLDSNISFINPVNNVDDYLSRSKIFALTSKFEGQPMALLEAMSCGCVPILTNFPGASEYILNDGNGFIANSNKVFLFRVMSCLDDKKLRTRLTKKAKKTVKDKYSEKNIQKYIDLMLQKLNF
jgi:glycosyltransferase involved in cell wall biosynthesis